MLAREKRRARRSAGGHGEDLQNDFAAAARDRYVHLHQPPADAGGHGLGELLPDGPHAVRGLDERLLLVENDVGARVERDNEEQQDAAHVEHCRSSLARLSRRVPVARLPPRTALK